MSVFSLKMLDMWRNSTSAAFFFFFFFWYVLWTKDLNQRHLKACRRKRAGYSEPVFGIWENCLSPAVLCSFLLKERWKQTGCRIRGKAVKNCIVLLLVDISATWSCWSSVKVFISKEVEPIWHTSEVVCGSKVFTNWGCAKHFWWVLQLCSRSCCCSA